jgi:hypothetical protein
VATKLCCFLSSIRKPSRKSTAWPIERLEDRTLFTDVTGIIAGNTTWTKANSPYVLTGNVFVRDNATLTFTV